jgi:lysophospholipase L1-like esterase
VPAEPGADVAFSERLVQADPAGKRMREVTVFLPYHRPAYLRSLEIADGAAAEPLRRPQRRLLVTGDSITQGAYASSSCSTYAVQLARLAGMELLNHGLGGHVYDERVLDPKLPYEPHLVAVAYGCNDWNRFTREEERERVRAFLTKLRGMFPAGKVGIAVITPLWRVDAAERHAGGTLREFSEAIADEAQRVAGVHVVDGTTLVEHREENFFDGCHPCDQGMQQYARNLCRDLKRKGFV